MAGGVSGRSHLFGSTLLIIGVLQFVILFLLASYAYPSFGLDHSISYILYNSRYSDISEGVAGAALLIATPLISRKLKHLTSDLMFIFGISSIGISVFTIAYGIIHVAISLILMVSGIVMLASTYDRVSAFGISSAALSAISFVSLVIFLLSGRGTLLYGISERLIIIPILLWGIILAVRVAICKDQEPISSRSRHS